MKMIIRSRINRDYMKAVILVAFIGLVQTLQAQTGSIDDGQTAEVDTLSLPGSEQAIAAGKALFVNHCAICHAIDHEVIGPALASAPQKRPLPWLIKFIQNSQEVINSGDEYAHQLFMSYNRMIMPSFEFLSTDEIRSILAYIHVESVGEFVQPEANVKPMDEVGRQTRAPDRYSRSTTMRSYEVEKGEPAFLTVLYVTLIFSLTILIWLGIRIFKNTH